MTPSASKQLKPCPFCGGAPEYSGTEGSGYHVNCISCGAYAGWGDYGYQAREKWNTRAEMPQTFTDAERQRVLDKLAAGWFLVPVIPQRRGLL